MDNVNTIGFCSELRLKDIERVTKQLDSVKALEKRGHSKEQKEELVICQKVLDWLESGKDIRYTFQFSYTYSLEATGGANSLSMS